MIVKNDELIYSLRASGMEFSEIGKQLNLSAGRCRNIYYQYNAVITHSDGRLLAFMRHMSLNAARRLLRAKVFTVEEASALTYDELCKLRGIGEGFAKEIYRGLHPDDKS